MAITGKISRLTAALNVADNELGDLYGRTPVWTRRWISRLLDDVNRLRQTSHLNGLRPPC